MKRPSELTKAKALLSILALLALLLAFLVITTEPASPPVAPPSVALVIDGVPPVVGRGERLEALEAERKAIRIVRAELAELERQLARYHEAGARALVTEEGFTLVEPVPPCPFVKPMERSPELTGPMPELCVYDRMQWRRGDEGEPIQLPEPELEPEPEPELELEPAPRVALAPTVAPIVRPPATVPPAVSEGDNEAAGAPGTEAPTTTITTSTTSP